MNTAMDTSARDGSASRGLAPAHVVRAELIKLTSLRSTWGLLAAGAVFTLATGLFGAAGAVFQNDLEGAPQAGFDPVAVTVTGVSTLVFLVAMISVLQVTGEITTGLARSTFTAVPRRGLVVAGKTAALAVLAAPVVLAVTAATFVAGQLILDRGGLAVAVVSPDAVRVVLGAAGYAIAVGVYAALLAWLLRSTVGAAFALLGVLALLGPLVGLLPARISNDIVPFLPGEAAAALMGADPTGASLSGVAALAVTLGWCVVALLGATRVARRRDI
jgi:hypothetical protein